MKPECKICDGYWGEVEHGSHWCRACRNSNEQNVTYFASSEEWAAHRAREAFLLSQAKEKPEPVKEATADFTRGVVVQLKSGGTPMTILRLDFLDSCYTQSGTVELHRVTTGWFTEDGEHRTQAFDPCVLQVVSVA